MPNGKNARPPTLTSGGGEERKELTHTTRSRARGGDHPRVARAPMATKKGKRKPRPRTKKTKNKRRGRLVTASQRQKGGERKTTIKLK